jgi:pimeloyl-ACP methyl ester carboxylesterase
MMTNPQFMRNRYDLNLAYDFGHGSEPILIFLSGFRSDMTGTKAQFLKQKSIERGQAYLLLDYSGHGQSEGIFEDGSIRMWYDDALEVIRHLCPPDQSIIVIGSSMGGWIALHVALALKNNVKGLIGIASAPDFTRTIWHEDMNEAQRQEMVETGVIYEPSKYGGPVPFTHKLITDSESMCLMDHPIDLPIPVALIHGQADEDVPWQRSQRLAENLPNSAVTTHFIADGDHRLSRPEDLAIFDRVVLDMVQKIR